MSSVRACRPFLLTVVGRLQPQAVVALGGTALRSLTNKADASVTAHRGRLLEVPGLKNRETDGGSSIPVYATYHPAAVLHGAVELEDAIVQDLRRVFSPPLEQPVDGDPSGLVLGCDTEYGRDGRLLTVGLSDRRVGLVEEPPDLSRVTKTLKGVRFIAAHSAAGDVEKLVENELPVREAWAKGEDLFDSLLLARMVDENKLSYELESLLADEANISPWKQETRAQLDAVGDMALVDSEARKRRCSLDAWAACELARRYYPRIKDALPLVRFTQQVASTVSRITLAGAFVALPVFESLAADLQGNLFRSRDLLAKAAIAQGMTEFSPSNDGHIRELLYTRLKLPVTEKTEKSRLPAVDKATLSQLDHDVVRLLLEYNKYEKTYSTNIEGLRALYTPVGVVDGCPVAFLPFHINPLGARTGRRASSDPNSQNWPKGVRGIIRSRFRNGLIGDFDYSKLEPIVLAWYANDERLAFAFSPKGGGYRYFAKELWGFDCGDDTPEYRATKSIILGTHYNMQTPKMAWQLWLLGVKFSADYDEHERSTDTLRRKYLSLVPGVGRFMEAMEGDLLRTGCSASASGRVRHLPLPDGRDTKGFGHALNQAINHPIQSFASDITGSAMFDLEGELLKLHGLTYVDYIRLLAGARKKILDKSPEYGIIQDEWGMSLLINEVHDDLVMDLHPDHLKRDTELVIETMRAVPTLRKLVPSFTIPLNVGVKVGPRWGEKA